MGGTLLDSPSAVGDKVALDGTSAVEDKTSVVVDETSTVLVSMCSLNVSLGLGPGGSVAVDVCVKGMPCGEVDIPVGVERPVSVRKFKTTPLMLVSFTFG